jgi:hypothetical protein
MDEQLAALARTAERLLAEGFGGPVRIGPVESLTEGERRNLIVRCALDDGPAGAPAQVVVKRATPPDDPAAQEFAAWAAFNDWAGPAFLSRRPADPPHGPHLERDDRWGLATLRQRLVARAELFAALADERGHLPEVGRVLGRVAAVLRERWTAFEELPPYAAFR